MDKRRIAHIKRKLVNNKLFFYTILPLYRMGRFVIQLPAKLKNYTELRHILKNRKKEKRVYYLGLPTHSNLGDLAQGVCINKWLQKHYKDYEIIGLRTVDIVARFGGILNLLAENVKDNDLIVFQSGYTTTDLGGDSDRMHRMVIQKLPHTKMVMMPQTVFFKHKSREELTSKVYNRATRLLFLARDSISYEAAKRMFPDVTVEKYPDIVTSLIGTINFESKRDGILFCCRDDEEKFYSDDIIADMVKACSLYSRVHITDTTKYVENNEILNDPESWIMKEIERYSHYKVIITDRYHGTIFSLIAGTPVVILRTTDHKVVTGADWFEGIYDQYVHLAQTPEHALSIVNHILNCDFNYTLESYFQKEYYDKLPELIQRSIDGGKQ